MSKFREIMWQHTKKKIMQDVEILIPIALMDTMDYFHQVVTPLVPIDTGALRESFESYLEGSTRIVGKWEVYDKGFPYGSYQYFNHNEYSYWIESGLGMYKGNMEHVFYDTMRRGLRTWRK